MPSFTFSPTYSPSPVPMPMQLLVTIHNSAGEQVRQLFKGTSQDSPQGFSADASGIIAMGAGLHLNFSGLLQNGSRSLTWIGDNDAGQAVGGGTYYIKAEMTDPFGAVESWSHAIAVLPQPQVQTLNIYNSAGELVASLNASSGSGQRLSKVGLRDNGKGAYAAGGTVDFVLEDMSGQQVIRSWDGKSSSGARVSPGSYTVQLLDSNAGNKVLVSKGFVLLGAPDSDAFDAMAGPNPVTAADKVLIFKLSGLKNGERASVRLYSLAGELVSQGAAQAGSQTLVLKVGNWASGIYVAVLEARDGQALVSRISRRIAVQR